MTTLDQCLAPATPAELHLALDVARYVHNETLATPMPTAVATERIRQFIERGRRHDITPRDVSRAVSRLVVLGILEPVHESAVGWKGAL
jgi:hypothetical protein